MSEQVRGKKNLVIERHLAGTIGLFVKFSTLQEYGVDKIFFLENHNVDSSQRNIVFLCHGEDAKTVQTVAGMSLSLSCLSICTMGPKVEYLDYDLPTLCIQSGSQKQSSRANIGMLHSPACLLSSCIGPSVHAHIIVHLPFAPSALFFVDRKDSC
jgi:hypothetical protein